MSDQVSGVLFDVGGVLVALDGMPFLAKLLRNEVAPEEIHHRWMTCPSVVLHETGRISAEEFAERVVEDLRLGTSPDAFLLEFGNWLGARSSETCALVERIPATYRVAVLSNMSAFHWNKVKSLELPARFEATYVSHEIGCLKPSHQAFQIALDGMALPASEVLFLDDSISNVIAARELGMIADVVTSTERVREVLERYGVVTGQWQRAR
jgi:FMN phosphatase YigB (HAD superfamily)